MRGTAAAMRKIGNRDPVVAQHVSLLAQHYLIPKVGMSEAIVARRRSLRQLPDYGLTGSCAGVLTDISHKSAWGKRPGVECRSSPKFPEARSGQSINFDSSVTTSAFIGTNPEVRLQWKVDSVGLSRAT